MFVMAGGGTGGHVIPGIAVARELRARGHQPLFIGTRDGMEARLVPDAGFPIEWIETGALKGYGLMHRVKSLARLPASVFRARLLLRRHGVQGVFSMGGYVAAPVVLGAWLGRIPVVLMEPNAMPGMTNRRMARLARRALVSFEEAKSYFPAGCVETVGLPVRKEFFDLKEKPRGSPPVLLVTGGSRGSRTLNHAVRDLMPLLASSNLQLRVVLQSGRDMYEEMTKTLEGTGCQVSAFLDNMPAAFDGADLILCRSGAGSVAELSAAGKPSILVPYPYAADDHQMANARAMEHTGAARVVADRDMNGERLLAEVRASLEPDVLETMGRAARMQAKPGAAWRAATLLEEYSATAKTIP